MQAMQVSEDPKEKTLLDKNGNPSEKDVESIEKQLKGLNLVPNDPPEVKRRIKAMKKLQVELLESECEFFKDLHDLETKYSSKYKKICDKRTLIITGRYEPTEEECAFSIPNEDESDDEEDANEKSGAAGGTDASKENALPVKGIPRFWLTVFQNVPNISEMIEEHDIPILEYLEDIKVELTKDPLGYRLDFKFSPNPHFTNAILTKSYEMRCKVDPKDPFAFEGPEIIKSSGCGIDWKDGKNVTVRTIQKKQKHKQSGAIRMVTKSEPCPSFFNFFSPPQSGDAEDDEDSEMERMTTDFQVGQYLRERVIPRAVLYYTGEIPASDDEDDDDYSSDADSDEESGEGSESGGSTAADEDNRDNAANK